MRSDRSWTWRLLILNATAIGIVLALAPAASAADEFQQSLSRIDRALQQNPNRVPVQALEACQSRRGQAALLHSAGHAARAKRSLQYCFNLLGVADEDETQGVDELYLARQRAAALAEPRERAEKEFAHALALKADLDRGLEIYRSCAACHTPEGWGLAGGSVPQLAGQHHNVVIKQLADIRNGNRENRVMQPFSSIEAIGGPQAVADVAGYIDTLEISIENGKGPGEDLELGKRLYDQNCTRCHGPLGEGDNEKMIPRVHAQHYNYLVDQFELIRDGKRRNANPEMVTQIKAFTERDVRAVMDYVSRLEPPAELQAPQGWRNPDFIKAATAD